MPDSLVRGIIRVDGVPEAVAGLRAYKAALTDLSTMRAGLGGQFQQQMKLGVDTSAVQTAKVDISALSTAHSALNGNKAALTIDTNSISQARAAIQGLNGDFLSAASAASKIGPAAAGLAIVAVGLGVATRSAEQFQQSMANLQSVLHAPPPDFTRLGAGIQEAARSSVFTVTQIADADRTLAKSGADTNAILREQADVLSLASAANTSAADASSGMIAAQKSFGETAKDSTVIANTLAQAVDSSVGTFNDMTEALKQVGPVAMQAGISLQDTTTAIAALQNAGLQGDTGTGLKIFLQRLEAPTGAAKSAIHDLGIEVYDADGKMKSLANIADQLRLATAGLSDEAKNADLTQIFGARGVRVADIFSSEGSDGLAAVVKHEADLGSAADIAQTKLATLSGQMAQLKSSGDTVAANIGGVLVPALSAAGSEFTDLLNSVTKLTSGLSDLGGASQYGQQVADAIKASTIAPIGDQPFTRDEQRVNLLNEQKKLTEDIARLQPDVDAAKGDILGHLLGNDGGKAQLDQAKEGLRQVNAEIAKLDPAALSASGLQALSKQESDLVSQFSRGNTTIDAAVTSAKAWAATALQMGANTTAVANSLQDFETALKNVKNAQDEQRYVQLKDEQDAKDRAKTLLNEGAPPSLVENAVFGKIAGIDPSVLVQQEAELKKWEQDYADTQAAIKKETAAHDADVKQSAIDVASFEKFQIQQVADAQIAAATKTADAWKAASQVVGTVDIGKGLTGLADAAPALDKAVADLSALGKADAPLTALAGIADRFKGIADAEKQASAAYNGYLLTLDQTDKRIASIDALKQRLMAAVDAAQQAKLRGTATAGDEAVIAGAPGAYAQLNSAEVTLKGNGSEDWSKIIANLPQWLQGQLQADSSTRAAVGDGKQLLLTVEADKTKAAQDLDAFEKEDRKAVIKITADTKDAIASIDALIAHMPTSIPLLITTQPGQADPTRGYGESSAPPPANPAGWNQYQPLSMSQYSSIVKEGSGGKASPFDDPTIYAAVLAAAQQYGVDPRVLLAFTKRENNNATNISPSLIAANNYGGIKYANQPGATPGPAAPANEGPTPYAAFNTPADFFKALAANLSTGMYAGDYQSGNLAGVSRRYVGSDEPGRVQDYATYATQYPANANSDPTRGYGAPITRGTGYGPGDVALGSSQTPTGGAASDAVAGSVRDQIVQKALQSVGQDKLVDYCEQFVEETVQAITGKRGATGKNETSASSAFASAQSQGLVRPANQAPQAGDIVYYPDPNGGAGHTAIYMGSGKQISTYDKGSESDPEARKIHIESISPGAQFVMVPGTQSDTTRANGAAGSGIPGQANVPSGVTAGSGIPSVQSLEELARAAAHVDEKGAALKQTLSTLAPKDFSATISQFNTIGPILDKMAHAGDTDTTTTTTKIQESAAALAKNVDLTNLWGQGLAAITNKTGNLATIEQQITSTVGGPLAANLNRQLSIMSDQAAIADRINTLTARKASIEAAIAQTATARQAQDTAESRNQTRQSWADQDVDTGLANRGRAENTRYTGVSRTEEDRSRQLAFEQQVQATELQNKLVDLQKTQQSTVYQRTSQEQLLEKSAAGASTGTQQGVLSARLAAMHEQDTAQKDLNTKAIDDIQLQIRAEAKKANLDSYNLETERIAEQRKHEDILQGITDEGVANTATRQARDRAHQQDLWNIQDARTKEDAANTARIAAIDAEITAQQALSAAAGDNLKAAQDALAIWQQTGVDVGLAATGLDNAALKLINAAQQAAYYASVSGLKTAAGVPYDQFPHPGASHAMGGYVSGGGIVGDSASGDMSTAEYVEGNYRVYPHDSPVTQRALMGTRHYAGGTVAPVRQSGDGGTELHMHFNGGASALSDDDLTDIQRYVDGKIAAAERRMKQSGRKHNAANGIRE